jgi:hypothetical protein
VGILPPLTWGQQEPKNDGGVGQGARPHSISNLKEEGETENDLFPKEEKHYVKMKLLGV